MLAFTLSFLLPGAGLGYLGLWGWGVLNFVLVLGVGVVAEFVLPEKVFDKNIGLIGAACSGGSGGLAMVLATQRKERILSAKRNHGS